MTGSDDNHHQISATRLAEMLKIADLTRVESAAVFSMSEVVTVPILGQTSSAFTLTSAEESKN